MKIIGAVVAVLIGAGCAEAGGAETEAIVGGSADRGDPAVVAIDIAGQALCSGALVAPNLVLTARHCVSETTEVASCPARAPQIRGNRDPRTLTIRAGNDAQTAPAVAIGHELVVPNVDVLCDADVAFVVLDRVVDLEPLPIDRAAPAIGDTLRLVGFGRTGDDGSAGRKRTRRGVPITAVRAAELEVGEVTCSGDSGGPAFADNGRIVGVTSRGGPGCEGPATHNVLTRVGAFHELLDRALDEAGRSAAAEDACGVHVHCPTGYACTAPPGGGPRACQRR